MQNLTEQLAKRGGRNKPWQLPMPSLTHGDGVDTHAQGKAGRNDSTREGAGGDQLPTTLGWLSIGIGVAQLLAPRAIARATGLPDSPLLLRAMGVREIMCGVGLLNQAASPFWRWSRVAGDAMDLTILGVAAGTAGSGRKRIAATAVAVAGVTALDVLASARRSPQQIGGPPRAGIPVEKSVTINRPADECYRFWRDLERLPRFMQHLESVQCLDERRSHWKARGPAGSSIEWDAEITEDQPGRQLAWRSVGNADVGHSGVVEFMPAPGGRGTMVQLRMRYEPPAGKVGEVAAKLLGEEPSQQIDEDLRRFKQLLEAGEIATTEGQAAGPRSLKVRLFQKGARQ